MRIELQLIAKGIMDVGLATGWSDYCRYHSVGQRDRD